MLNFDQNGNLITTQSLSFYELRKQLGYNDNRKHLLDNAVIFLKIFKSLGCTNVYLVGSFITREIGPKDIDICIDITYANYFLLKEQYPAFFTYEGIELIRKEYKCHFVGFFDSYSLEILDWFRWDRNGNPRGLIKITLNDIIFYDKK